MRHVFTRTGDQRTTTLFTGEVVRKSSVRVNSYGTIDEVVSNLGLARASSINDDVAQKILWLQNELVAVMAELSQTNKEKNYTSKEKIDTIESMILELEKGLKPLTNFIIPGDDVVSSMLHICRTILRRAEREVCGLAEKEFVNNYTLVFLNRASDLCFILARCCAENDIVSLDISD